MNFVHPIALLWAGLAIPVVVFYILKIRMRRVPVSTILFWRQIFEEKQPRSIWQRLRHLLSLLVQLAFLLLIVAAVAEPIFNWEIREARRIVLIVDNSASMNASDIEPTRLDAARKAAEPLIEGLRYRDELAILSAGTQPQVQSGLTGHQSTLRAALRSIPATDGPTRIKEAVDLARRLLADQPRRKIVIVTDGGFPEFDAIKASEDVQIVPVGKKTSNLAITRFQARRSLLDPIGYQILAEVQNASDEKVESRLELELEGRIIDVVPLALEAGERKTQVFEKTSAEGGRLTARLNRPDALSVDNTAVTILPRRETLPVTLVTDGDLFLEKVFEANPLVRLTVVKELPKDGPGAALTVWHRKVANPLPPGNHIFIDPRSATDLWTVGETLQNPVVEKQDRQSPLMTHIRLDNVLMPEARQLKFTAPGTALATALTGDPLYYAIERPEGKGKVLVLTVDLDKGDLPLQTAFPIMVANSLGWFTGTRGELREALASGAVADIELPPGSGSATGSLDLIAPDGRSRSVPLAGGKVTVGPLDRCGIWSLRRPAGPNDSASKGLEQPPILEIACNLSSRTESDLRPPPALLDSSGAATPGGGLGGWPLWFTLAVVAGTLLTVEWYLYQRRWIS
jgi:hypothetical protein